MREIDTLLHTAGFIVAYAPLRTEVPFRDFIAVPGQVEVYEIPPRAALDPIEEAAVTTAAAAGRTTVLLIPGRKFDASGTRHGQGGGWYDRFLANVPREWLRIGVCWSEQFSSVPLMRESWDQSMDYVVVVNRATGQTVLYSPEGIPT